VTPKEAHEFARRVSMPCPCCGQPLVLTVSGEGAEAARAARKIAEIVVFAREHATLELVTVEQCAEEIVEGKGEPARVPRPA
jgi:hypothetical protein